MSNFVVGFDLDQTLVDTRARILQSDIAAFADLGVEVSRSELVPYLGKPLQLKAATFLPGHDPEVFAVRYRHHYRLPTRAEAPAFAGAREALLEVRNGGGRVAVISAKVQALVDESLAETGLAELVDSVHGGHFGTAKGTVLRELRAAVYVGDHPADIDAARAGNCVAVAVATGVTDADGLAAAGADVVLADLTEMSGWLARYRAGGASN